MRKKIRVIYVTSWVLGDSGANAADIFPTLSVRHPLIEKVIVADFPKNKHHIRNFQKAVYLKLVEGRCVASYALRIARKATQENIDIIHIFYRQKNAVLAVFLGVLLYLLRNKKTKILMDHRSVNLAKGYRGLKKRTLNTVMRSCVHKLSGNPWAVETNHFKLYRPHHIIDLGYDKIPYVKYSGIYHKDRTVNVWYIGSLKPRNRKTEFLLEALNSVTSQLKTRDDLNLKVRINIAGPASESQLLKISDNRKIVYHGTLDRQSLYQRLRENPGVGLAYMNREFHEYAPSLKFAEYAAMQFPILASNTKGLRIQADRMQIRGVSFVAETVDAWSDAIISSVRHYTGPAQKWENFPEWSYERIFERQVIPIYQGVSPTGKNLY